MHGEGIYRQGPFCLAPLAKTKELGGKTASTFENFTFENANLAASVPKTTLFFIFQLFATAP